LLQEGPRGAFWIWRGMPSGAKAPRDFKEQRMYGLKPVPFTAKGARVRKVDVWAEPAPFDCARHGEVKGNVV